MKLDKSIKSFTEKYDEACMSGIERVSRTFTDPWYEKINSFNMNESREMFEQVISGYEQYMMSKPDDPDGAVSSQIVSKFKESVDKDFFKDAKLSYPEFPQFITSYVESLTKMTTDINGIISRMMSNEVLNKNIGAVTEMADYFFDEYERRFDECIETMIFVSGNKSAATKEKLKPGEDVFL